MTIDKTTDRLGAISRLDELNAALDPLSMMAGWNKHEPSLWREPRTAFEPRVWPWRYAKAGLDTAGRLISAEQAERRTLFLRNPMEGNRYSTVRTLVSAYQMILPGERAPSHRHTPNALRLVLDVDEACYTVVDGVRIDMKPGDVVLTPNWSWHGHGNDGGKPGYWLDILDVPLVHLLEPMFLEHWSEGFQQPTQTTRDSPFVFSWEDSQQALSRAELDATGRYGARVELGSPALPTIAVHMQRLPAGLETRSFRTTASQIFCAISGAGRTIIGGEEFRWTRGDAIVIPSWHTFSHHAEDEAVLFSASDEPALSKLGFLREADD